VKIGDSLFRCYEKRMTKSRQPSAPASRKAEDWVQLVMAVGLGAMITSAAGLLHDVLAARQQSCSLSQQIVGDETPNPALSLLDRRTLATQARARLTQCLGDRK
jgi:hypothetical protein